MSNKYQIVASNFGGCRLGNKTFELEEPAVDDYWATKKVIEFLQEEQIILEVGDTIRIEEIW